MCRALFEKVILLATFVALVVLSIIVASILAPTTFKQITNNLLAAIGDVAHAVAIGAMILFAVGLVLGVCWVLTELRHRKTYRVIGHNKYGPAQALTQLDGTVVPLQNGQMQMDPALMLEFVRKAMQISSQAATMARRDYYIGEEKPVEQIEGPEEEEQIPDVVNYADIADEVPESMSLLGIHPANGDLELTDWEKLKMVWLVGSSSTGKSNTIFGKAYEAANKQAKLAVVDQHAPKKDSLARKLASLSHAFVREIAVSDQQVLDTLAWFKAEFERRVHCPVCRQSNTTCPACSQKIVLICDEMNRMVRNEALIKPLKEIVAICGQESRGFGMYGWFLSQKCAGLKWLRDNAITVIVHRLTRIEEAKMACNDDMVAARKLLKFKIGRTYIYGVDFDEPVELQQPLYEVTPSVVESTIEEIPQSTGSENTSVEQSSPESDKQAAIKSVQEDGQPLDRTFPLDFSKLKQVRKMILEQRNQNDIICEVWGVTENSRAFRAAKEEFRQYLAYFASMAGEM